MIEQKTRGYFYHNYAAVQDAVLRYVNNRGSQRAVKIALREAGAPDQLIDSINWNKGYFVTREFEP